MSPAIRPPHSIVLLVGREDYAAPTTFGGTSCVATPDCVAVATLSPVDGPTVVSVAPTAPAAGLVELGEFTIESEGQVSVRDVFHREHDAMGVEPGHVSVRVLANHAQEPDEVLFVVSTVLQAAPSVVVASGVQRGGRTSAAVPPTPRTEKPAGSREPDHPAPCWSGEWSCPVSAARQTGEPSGRGWSHCRTARHTTARDSRHEGHPYQHLDHLDHRRVRPAPPPLSRITDRLMTTQLHGRV